MQTLIRGPKLDRLLAELRSAPAGDVVELGVYAGGTLLEMARVAPERRIYGFDTFEGLPQQAWTAGEPHGVGDFRDADFEAIRAALPQNVTLVRGVFPGSAALIEPRIALAHVDMDYYVSTRDAIAWLLPRMVAGGVIAFDDVDWPHCPGVRRAIDEAGLVVEVVAGHQGLWRK